MLDCLTLVKMLLRKYQKVIGWVEDDRWVIWPNIFRNKAMSHFYDSIIYKRTRLHILTPNLNTRTRTNKRTNSHLMERSNSCITSPPHFSSTSKSDLFGEILIKLFYQEMRHNLWVTTARDSSVIKRFEFKLWSKQDVGSFGLDEWNIKWLFE